MSLPSELRQWACCPECGSSGGLRRLGNVGVPPSMYGKRRRTYDSKRVKCTECNIVFYTSQGTMLENMGREPREDIPF